MSLCDVLPGSDGFRLPAFRPIASDVYGHEASLHALASSVFEIKAAPPVAVRSLARDCTCF
jgi:hypothetical protein